MTAKQMLLSALILGATVNRASADRHAPNIFYDDSKLGATANVVLETEKPTNQSIPNELHNFLFIYTITKKDYGCTETDNINLQAMPMDAETLAMFKKVGKEKDFIRCPLSIPNFPKQVNLYNHQSPYVNEFDACNALQKYLQNPH